MDRNWAAREAAEIGLRVAQRRAALDMSAQRLADRCAELGMPEITRPVLVKLEHGRREAVSTAELAVLATALGTAPVLLLYPIGGAKPVEALPARHLAPWDAAKWFSGDALLSDDPAGPGVVPARSISEIPLHREHDRLVSAMAGTTRETYISGVAGRQQFAEGEAGVRARLLSLGVAALRDVRAWIRELGLEPPELPPDLVWVDEEGG